MTLVTATVKDKTTVTAATNSVTVSGSSPVTEQINGVTIGTVASGGTNNQVIENTDGTTVGTTANPSVVGDSTATVNGVSMATIPAEGTENIQVRQETGATLVGSKQGQFWRIDNSQAQVNGVNTETIPATVTHNQLIQDTAGATVGTEANPSVVADASVTVNSAAFDTVVAEGTIDVPVEYVNGTPVGTINAGVVQIPNPLTPPSVSLAISDSTPNYGDTITITATPSDITPTSYTFILPDCSEVTQVGNTYNCRVNVEGACTVRVEATDGVSTISGSASATVTTIYARHSITAAWEGKDGVVNATTGTIENIPDAVGATYTATAPSSVTRMLKYCKGVLDNFASFAGYGNSSDRRLATTLSGLNATITYFAVFFNTQDATTGGYSAQSLLGGDAATTLGSRYDFILQTSAQEIKIIVRDAAASAAVNLGIAVKNEVNVCVAHYDGTDGKLIANGSTVTSAYSGSLLTPASSNIIVGNSLYSGLGYAGGFTKPIYVVGVATTAVSDPDRLYSDLLLKYTGV